MPDLTYDLMSVQAVTLQENESLFSFLRQPSTRHCPHLLPCALLRPAECRTATGRYYLRTGLTAANLPRAAAAGEWDRQTDGRTADGFVDASRQ